MGTIYHVNKPQPEGQTLNAVLYMCAHMYTYVQTYVYIYIFIYYIKFNELFEKRKETHRSGEKGLQKVMGGDFGQRKNVLHT